MPIPNPLDWLKERRKWLWLLVILVVVAAGIYHFWPEPPIPPTKVDSSYKPAATGETITRGSSKQPALPLGVTAKETRGTLHIEFPKPAGDTSGGGKTSIDVVIPKGNKAPEIKTSDTTLHAEATYHEFVNPWLALEWSIFAGATVDSRARPSPFAGVSLVNFFDALHLGAGVDRSGVGPFAGFQLSRDDTHPLHWWSVDVKYNLVTFTQTPAQWSFGLAYWFSL